MLAPMSSAASTRAPDAAVTLRRAGVAIPLAGRPAIRGLLLAVAIAFVPVAVSAV